jgi:hypothetical protein
MSILKRTIPTPTFRRSDSGTVGTPIVPPIFSPFFSRSAPEVPTPEPAPAPPPPTTILASPAAEPDPAAKLERRKVKKTTPPPDPRKGGRKRHNPQTTRSVKVTISLSQEEADVMAAAAAKSGMAFSAWARHIIFDVARTVQRPHAERGLLEGSDR